MDRNLENWLREKPIQPEEAGKESSQKMQDDVAALLGLPVAVYRGGRSVRTVLPLKSQRPKGRIPKQSRRLLHRKGMKFFLPVKEKEKSDLFLRAG